VASFHSTLSEALAASLLLHVADASSHTLRPQMEAVESTLREMEVEEERVMVVFNKVDAADPEVLDHLATRFPNSVFISAVTKEGLPQLREVVFDILSRVHGSAGYPVRQDAGVTPVTC